MTDIAYKVQEVIRFLEELEIERGRCAGDVYTIGNCGNFYTLLKAIFPDVQAIGYRFISPDFPPTHIETKIGEYLFDFNGQIIEDNPEHYICKPAFDSVGELMGYYYRTPATDAEVEYCSNNFEAKQRGFLISQPEYQEFVKHDEEYMSETLERLLNYEFAKYDEEYMSEALERLLD